MSKKGAKTISASSPISHNASSFFYIKYPLLWLAAAVFILYLPTLHFGFTDLDDAIFIKDMHAYNEDLSNLVTSFQRGVFNATKDNYYRPLFLDSIILNYQFAKGTIEGYRFVNILLHLGCVILLYKLFLRLKIDKLAAFTMSLLFAVHPVLCQAVVWIPGRNDTLMALFILLYFIFSIDYSEKQKTQSLLWSSFFLLLSLFTKETAFIAPLALLLIQLLILKKKVFEKAQWMQYCVWIAAAVVYFAVRSSATLKANDELIKGNLLTDFFTRLPLIIQYLGKIFLPFNLSVFPVLQDTVYYFGIAAVILLAAILFFTKEKKWNWYVAGFGFFLLFLLPVLLLPDSLNQQTFEHRLYLPVIGIFLLLSQTFIFQKNATGKKITYILWAIAAFFAALNFNHQQYFKDALTFWEQGYNTSPHSAYATMMYGARVENKQEGYALMRKAYSLNPDEKYLNYYYGMMLQNQDSLLESEKYFLMEKKNSGYYECDFYLAKIAFKKKDFKAAAAYLEDYTATDKTNEMANNNLLLLYMSELKDKAKAKAQAKKMQDNGILIPQNVLQQINAMP